MDGTSLLWAFAWWMLCVSIQVSLACGAFLWWLWRPKTVFFSGQAGGQN